MRVTQIKYGESKKEGKEWKSFEASAELKEGDSEESAVKILKLFVQRSLAE